MLFFFYGFSMSSRIGWHSASWRGLSGGALAGGVGADNDQACAGWIRLFNPASTTFAKSFLARDANYQDSDYINDGFCAGYFNTTSDIDAVQFKMTSDAIDAGDICLYGIK